MAANSSTHRRKIFRDHLQTYICCGPIITVAIAPHQNFFRFRRSADGHSLVTSLSKIQMGIDRSAGPWLWNSLPQCMRNKSLFYAAAVFRISFSALLHSILQATHYYVLRSLAWLVFTWYWLVVDCLISYECGRKPYGSAYAIQGSPAWLYPVFVTLRCCIMEKHSGRTILLHRTAQLRERIL